MIGVIICHKSLAYELIITTKAIVGHQQDLFPFSNDRISAEKLMQDIQQFLESKNAPPEVVFMVDLRGGNCWKIARTIARTHPNYYVLSGVNLPMIFSFLSKKDLLSPQELLQTMENDAHRGITLEK